MPVWLRYSLVQIPGLLGIGALAVVCVTQGWFALHWGVALFLAWLAKDLLLYPLVRRSFIRRAADAHLPQPGELVTVERALSPEGFVRIGPEIWKARTEDHSTVPVGASVCIISRKGIFLTVRATRTEDANASNAEDHA